MCAWGTRRSPRLFKAQKPKHRLLRSRRGPMLSLSYSISPKGLWNAIAARDAPQLVDVRRRDAYEQSPHLLPGAVWRDAAKTKEWKAEFDATRPIVTACKAGHEMSQSAVANNCAPTASARAFWKAVMKAGRTQAGPWSPKSELDRLTPKRPSVSGDAPAPENRSHRLPLADLPFSGSAGADSVCRPGPGGQRRA